MGGQLGVSRARDAEDDTQAHGTHTLVGTRRSAGRTIVVRCAHATSDSRSAHRSPAVPHGAAPARTHARLLSL